MGEIAFPLQNYPFCLCEREDAISHLYLVLLFGSCLSVASFTRSTRKSSLALTVRSQTFVLGVSRVIFSPHNSIAIDSSLSTFVRAACFSTNHTSAGCDVFRGDSRTRTNAVYDTVHTERDARVHSLIKSQLL